MGLVNRLGNLFSRRQSVGPKEYAMTGMAIAESHVRALRKHFPDVPDDTWYEILAEAFRAYFGVVSLVVGKYISDDRALSHFGGLMLQVLQDRHQSTETVAEAFADDDAVMYAVRAYCQNPTCQHP